MKNTILLLAAGLLTSQFTFAQTNLSIEQRLKNANAFEILHCKPSESKATNLVVHYIIDIQDNSVNELYVSPGESDLKGKNLKNLKLIDTVLTEINTDTNSDLSFVSVKNDLKFKLSILDTDGQYLSGSIDQKHQTIPVTCKDITIE